MADDAFPLPGVSTISTITEWEDFFHPAYGSGVVPGIGNELLPTLDATGRAAVLAPGKAIVRAFLKPISASTPTAIPAPDAQDRIDRLVLRLDRSAATGPAFVQPVVITGTPSASPVTPGLTRTDTGIWDLPMAHWTSAASGALSGLADERVFLAGPVLIGTSKHSPVLTRPGLLVETDTGKLRMSTRAGVWDTTVYQPPDTWHTVSLKHGWSGKLRVSYADPYRRMVHIASAGNLGPGNHNNGVVIGTIPSGYRPKSTQQFPVTSDDSTKRQNSHFAIRRNGDLLIWGIGVDANSVAVNAGYPLDLS